MQAYSDPSRETDPRALPDVEVFHLTGNEEWNHPLDDSAPRRGWYWWSCFPGCLPDGDPIGPFDSEREALADAQDVL
jgi:hypothetical protein